MADMGVPYDTKKATEGMAEGKASELENVHSPPGEGKGTEEAQKQHAYATPSSVDPPIEMGGGHHGHRGNPKKN
jgi:hypothetical protein